MKKNKMKFFILTALTLSILNSCGSKGNSVNTDTATTAVAETKETLQKQTETMDNTVSETSDTSVERSDGSTETASVKEAEATADEITVESQTISMTGIGNARELGGYKTDDGRMIRHGVLLRTAALAKASEEDIKRLVDEYGLTTVIDFRMTMENASAPDPEIPGVENLSVHIIDEEVLSKKNADNAQDSTSNIDMSDPISKLDMAIKLGILSDRMYIDFLSSDVGKAGYTKFFDELKELPEGKSLLFHCTQGKDRTGCGAMLILSALGVPEETIMKDYLLTNEFNAEKIAGERKLLESRDIDEDKYNLYMLGMDEVFPETMTNALEWIKDEYGSPVEYIKKELGVSDADIEALKDKFLTEA